MKQMKQSIPRNSKIVFRREWRIDHPVDKKNVS